MGVGNIIPIDGSFIASYRFFRNRVNDFIACRILGKIRKRILPFIFCCHFHRIYLLAICKKIHCDRLRPNPILVFSIIPVLVTFNCNSFRNIVNGNLYHVTLTRTIHFDLIKSIIKYISSKCSNLLNIVQSV